MRNKLGKIWGNTCNIFNKNNVEIHRIEIKKGGFCSKHQHAHKYNLFFVESGRLKVVVCKNDYNLEDITILEAGESTIVPYGEYHRFEALEKTICYEIYWVELDTQDIIRDDCGGSIDISNS